MIPLRAFYPPAALTPADRQMIGKIVEQLIEVLDLAAGDCDLEDDDPSGDSLDMGEDDPSRDLLRPAYGVDQSKGPINEREMAADYQRTLWRR